VLGLFSTAGFTAELQAAAAGRRGATLLVPLEMLYGQDQYDTES
jgi:hypothetical protein